MGLNKNNVLALFFSFKPLPRITIGAMIDNTRLKSNRVAIGYLNKPQIQMLRRVGRKEGNLGGRMGAPGYKGFLSSKGIARDGYHYYFKKKNDRLVMTSE
ncbi:hypothetical protein EYC84_006640 [Monilinia fructicola]|uniref:Uncharacterized protein n=1 Tax=Monilinia fructicola TaxID=38448 RepID=A0A5M9K8X3_MONFR|nr:hypothetical protein EYC84_006640 [Monilinia fructicola]